jgi:Uma2 family endonuclease
MAEVVQQSEQPPVVVHTRPVIEIDDDQFFRFCQLNPDLHIERSAEGDIIIMAPAGGSSSAGNAALIYAFESWARVDRTGRVFDSSGGFKLPNGATRSPDVSWVTNNRLESLSERDWDRFLPLCPDFVLELRFPTDSLRQVQRKMEEYRDNGARLGWLLDPVAKQAFVYSPNRTEVIAKPTTISGEPVLRGFTLDVATVWEAMHRKKS